MTKCAHERFIAQVSVIRLTDTDDGPVTGYTSHIHVKCEQCSLPFRFRGTDYGSSPFKPMLSADGLELRAPLEPAHATEILGMPIVSGKA